MKKSLLVSLAFLLTGAIVHGQGGGDYWPLAVDNYWVLLTDTLECPDYDSSRIGQLLAVKGTDSISELSGEYFRLRRTVLRSDGSSHDTCYVWLGEDSGAVVLAAFGNDSIVDYATVHEPPQVLLPDSIEPGDSWEYRIFNNTFWDSVISITDTVELDSLGTFYDCLKILEIAIDTASGDTNQNAYRYFALDVGYLVYEEVDADSCRQELVDYHRENLVQEDGEPEMLHHLHLHRNYPNPFRTATTISYALPTNTQVRLSVYDTAGRLITTLVDQAQEAGYYSVPWNRTDMFGNRVTSGVYFYRIETGEYTATKKMILLR